MLSHFGLVQLYVTPMDCSLSGSSVHGTLQARILEWVAISFSRASSQLGLERSLTSGPGLQETFLKLLSSGNETSSWALRMTVAFTTDSFSSGLFWHLSHAALESMFATYSQPWLHTGRTWLWGNQCQGRLQALPGTHTRGQGWEPWGRLPSTLRGKVSCSLFLQPTAPREVSFH